VSRGLRRSTGAVEGGKGAHSSFTGWAIVGLDLININGKASESVKIYRIGTRTRDVRTFERDNACLIRGDVWQA
jgi:hypothetical protein